MTHAILAKRHLRVLSEFALANVLLAFDYDGTLAPIAATPAGARMRAGTRRLLARVARLYPCVVISGRTLDDVATRLDGIPLLHLYGNHGLEPVTTKGSPAGRTRQWARRLSRELPGDLGVTIEDKTHTVSVHYRDSADKVRALKAIDEAVSRLPGARALAGAESVSVLPIDGADKGVALQQARRQFDCDTAIYVGDDGSDEVAFASAGADRLLAIRVGAARTSSARYHLRAQAEIDALLRMLAALRESRSRDRALRAASRLRQGFIASAAKASVPKPPSPRASSPKGSMTRR